jgi:hypothetical protein
MAPAVIQLVRARAQEGHGAINYVLQWTGLSRQIRGSSHRKPPRQRPSGYNQSMRSCIVCNVTCSGNSEKSRLPTSLSSCWPGPVFREAEPCLSSWAYRPGALAPAFWWYYKKNQANPQRLAEMMQYECRRRAPRECISVRK